MVSCQGRRSRRKASLPLMQILSRGSTSASRFIVHTAIVTSSQAQALRLDFCSFEAAKYAVDRWYYRSEMPRGKTVKIGVWENGEFIGVVIFGMGASSELGKRWG